MIALLVDLEVKAGRLEDFMIRIRQQADNSVTLEPGCLQFDVSTDGDSINLLAIRLYTLNDLQSSELFIEPERDNLVRTRDKVENSRVVDGEEPCDGGIFMVGTSILL